MRSGRPIVLDSFSPKSRDDPREYPILLAENLTSVVGVPIMFHECVLGVLLIGCRSARLFDAEVVDLMLDFE